MKFVLIMFSCLLCVPRVSLAESTQSEGVISGLHAKIFYSALLEVHKKQQSSYSSSIAFPKRVDNETLLSLGSDSSTVCKMSPVPLCRIFKTHYESPISTSRSGLKIIAPVKKISIKESLGWTLFSGLEELLKLQGRGKYRDLPKLVTNLKFNGSWNDGSFYVKTEDGRFQCTMKSSARNAAEAFECQIQ